MGAIKAAIYAVEVAIRIVRDDQRYIDPAAKALEAAENYLLEAKASLEAASTSTPSSQPQPDEDRAFPDGKRPHAPG